MKTAPLAPLVLLLLITLVIAQVKTETSDQPDISVLEKSWSKKTRYREWNQNPRADIRTPNEDPMKEARVGGRTAEIRRIIGHRHTIYVYKIKARNDGLKTIKALYWEYQFLYPGTQTVLATHRIVSSKKLSPGKTGVFKAEMAEPPVAFVSDDQFDQEFQLKFTERLIILRVDYTDGSVWRRP
jgi:hypothetical protein